MTWGCRESFIWKIIPIRSSLKLGRLIDLLQMTCVLSLLCLPVLDSKMWLTLIVVIIACWLISFSTKWNLLELQVSQNFDKLDDLKFCINKINMWVISYYRFSDEKMSLLSSNPVLILWSSAFYLWNHWSSSWQSNPT